MLKLCNAVYWLALTIWVGVLVAAGVAATSAFTTLPDPELGVRLERFSQYEAGNHGRIAAGHVMEPIFTFVDLAQVVAGGLVLITLVMQFTVFRMKWLTISNLVRTLCIAAALGLFAYRVFTITPEMNRDLRAYWSAAQAGDAVTAEHHFTAFTANHPRASRLFNMTLVLLLVSVAASGAALGPTSIRSAKREGELETPKLAKTH